MRAMTDVQELAVLELVRRFAHSGDFKLTPDGRDGSRVLVVGERKGRQRIYRITTDGEVKACCETA